MYINIYVIYNKWFGKYQDFYIFLFDFNILMPHMLGFIDLRKIFCFFCILRPKNHSESHRWPETQLWFVLPLVSWLCGVFVSLVSVYFMSSCSPPSQRWMSAGPFHGRNGTALVPIIFNHTVHRFTRSFPSQKYRKIIWMIILVNDQINNALFFAFFSL